MVKALEIGKSASKPPYWRKDQRLSPKGSTLQTIGSGSARPSAGKAGGEDIVWTTLKRVEVLNCTV